MSPAPPHSPALEDNPYQAWTKCSTARMSVRTLKHCINTFELPFGPPHPTLESPALFTVMWQLWGRGSHTPSLSIQGKKERGRDVGQEAIPQTHHHGCGLLGEAPGHLSAPLFGPWSLRLGRAAGEGLGSAGCPLPLQRQTGREGYLSGPSPERR